jgi:hypothetical protein
VPGQPGGRLTLVFETAGFPCWRGQEREPLSGGTVRTGRPGSQPPGATVLVAATGVVAIVAGRLSNTPAVTLPADDRQPAVRKGTPSIESGSAAVA